LRVCVGRVRKPLLLLPHVNWSCRTCMCVCVCVWVYVRAYLRVCVGRVMGTTAAVAADMYRHIFR